MCNCDSVFQKPLNDSGKYFFKKIHILVVSFDYEIQTPQELSLTKVFCQLRAFTSGELCSAVRLACIHLAR
jgi:hypothetical protein